MVMNRLEQSQGKFRPEQSHEKFSPVVSRETVVLDWGGEVGAESVGMVVEEAVEDYDGYVRLWKAVLLDGLRLAVRTRLRRGRAGRRQRGEREMAREWIRDAASEAGSCRWVCRVTGEDHGRVVAWVAGGGQVGQRRQKQGLGQRGGVG